MGLSSQIVSWDLNSGQYLHYGQQRRSFLLVCGAGAAQDVCVTTLFKSPWPSYPSLSFLTSFQGRRTDGQISCSSSSVRKSSSPSGSVSVDSSGARITEQLWEEYFADPSQWWDNRVEKRNPRSPDFKHKVTREALWLNSWSTPAWVKMGLNSVTQARYGTRDSQDSSQPNRLFKDNNGKRKTLPPSAREWRQIVQGGDGSMHMQTTRTMNKAIAILETCLQQGIAIDSYMYVEVLKRCLRQKDLKAAKQVHDYIVKSGMEQNAYVVNNLLSVYIRCGRLQDARRVFDALVKKDVISWNVMIGGYAQHGHAKDAIEVFHQMFQECVQADEITYVNILKACASSSALKWGKEVHAHIRRDGLESDVRVGTALLTMYTKCGMIKEARQFFDKLTNRNVVSWNVMVGAYAESGCVADAYELFLRMQREGFKPDAITYLSILNTSASAGALEWVKEVHTHVLGAGLLSDLRVANALVHMYAECGSIDDARLVFDRMEERDVISWNGMIGAYAESGNGVEAHKLFVQMKQEGFKSDAITYLSILNASASVGALEWVKEVHRHALLEGLESDVRVGTALVHMYAKSGSIDDARVVFSKMKERNFITWNSMISAYGENGDGVEAYKLFVQMKQEGIKPDAVTYVTILNAYASTVALNWVKEIHRHAFNEGFELDVRVCRALVHTYAKCGSIDDARLVFDGMKKRNLIAWTAMIDAYAESGHGAEAYQLSLQMKQEGF